jgi:hypothetical protein
LLVLIANSCVAGLQEVRFGRRARRVGRTQHREDRADRHVDVQVARAVERVEHQQVGAARHGVGDRQRLVHLLAGHAGEVPAGLDVVDEQLVGQDVELLLLLALDVHVAAVAVVAGEHAAPDRRRDVLARRLDVVEQGGQVGVEAEPAGFLHEELAEGGASDFHRDLGAVGGGVLRLYGSRVAAPLKSA